MSRSSLRRLALAVALTCPALALAREGQHDDATSAPRWRVTAETDIIATVVSLTNVPSYSLHVGVKPPWAPHWLGGVGVFGATRMPDFFVSLLNTVNGANNPGWQLEAHGVALRLFHYFSERGSGFYAGSYFAWMRWEQTNPEQGSLTRANQLMLWPAAGYRWFPFNDVVFVSAFASAGITSPSFGVVRSGPATYQELRWYPFAAVHLGFEL